MDIKLIFKFLKDLREHNNREWFEANKEIYKKITEELEQFVAYILKELTVLDPGMSSLKVKDCMFRINRDIRFSTDKTPYKTNIGIVFSPGGKNSGQPACYFHLEPDNKSFVGGGLYYPSSDYLAKIRQEIDYNTDEFKKILNNPQFQKFYSGLEGEKLKTAPRGYKADHPEIELLKFKHYIVTHNLTDEVVSKEGLKELVSKGFKTMKPLNDFLKAAIS